MNDVCGISTVVVYYTPPSLDFFPSQPGLTSKSLLFWHALVLGVANYIYIYSSFALLCETHNVSLDFVHPERDTVFSLHTSYMILKQVVPLTSTDFPNCIGCFVMIFGA